MKNRMIKYLVIRPKDKVIVGIMKHKEENKYSFINLTKNHICPCKFGSPVEALEDMDKLKSQGKIISYERIWF